MQDYCDVGPGSRVGLLLKRSVDTYVSILATLKCSATFVPMDASFPADRVAFIIRDSRCELLLTTSDLLHLTGNVLCPVAFLDQTRFRDRCARLDGKRLRAESDEERGKFEKSYFILAVKAKLLFSGRNFSLVGASHSYYFFPSIPESSR